MEKYAIVSVVLNIRTWSGGGAGWRPPAASLCHWRWRFACGCILDAIWTDTRLIDTTVQEDYAKKVPSGGELSPVLLIRP